MIPMNHNGHNLIVEFILNNFGDFCNPNGPSYHHRLMLQPTFRLVAHADCLAISPLQRTIFLVPHKYLSIMDELDYSGEDYLMIEQ